MENEFSQTDREENKLTIEGEPGILQGLIEASDLEGLDYVHFAKSAPLNFVTDKRHEGVGNLFAYACKRSWDAWNEDFVSL